jgi:hypothetical protein
VGVAVQFDGAAAQVRARLEPLCRASGIGDVQRPDKGRRRAPRAPARVQAKIETSERSYKGHTRNISRSGVLVAVAGEGPEIGEKVGVTLREPESGERLTVQGVVMRHVERDGVVSAVGVEFAPGEGERDGMERFVDEVQNVEHNRRLGGIKGDVGEVGIQNVLQMFATSTRQGTLALQRGEVEGLIGFDGGRMQFVKMGSASGMKALVRLMSWDEGSFEFHARLDPIDQMEAPIPVDAALLEAMRLVDEGRLMDPERFPADARPTIHDAADDGDHSKVEDAVLDLARAGFTVQRIVDVIPEPDPEIYRALENLTDGGVLGF